MPAAFLTITAATERGRSQPDDQSPLTRNEISRLLTATIIRPARHPGPLTWSSCRRRHYRRQAATEDHDPQLEY